MSPGCLYRFWFCLYRVRINVIFSLKKTFCKKIFDVNSIQCAFTNRKRANSVSATSPIMSWRKNYLTEDYSGVINVDTSEFNEINAVRLSTLVTNLLNRLTINNIDLRCRWIWELTPSIEFPLECLSGSTGVSSALLLQVGQLPQKHKHIIIRI